MTDCIYLTIEQIDALHDLAHRTDARYGAIQTGVQITTDAAARSNVSLVASFTDGTYSDNSFADISAEGAYTHWER